MVTVENMEFPTDRKYYTKVVARQMQMLDRKAEEDDAESAPVEEDEFPFD